MTMAVIANGKYLGGGFKAAPQVSVSDGLLDIVILKNSSSFKMLEESSA
jgi:diacylglycerol kinase family enzyme